MIRNMKILIKGGRVVDPANNLDKVCDVLIENGKISKVALNIKTDAKEIIDASSKIVVPGLVDMHVHLREPGREDKETVKSGTLAALAGGVTSLLAMPNTQPPIDSKEHLDVLGDIINKTARANVFIAASITKGRLGEELVDIASLKKQGIVAITDDGDSVDSDILMSSAFSKAGESNVLVICHCEDKLLSMNGAVNLGFTSTRMGLRGISKESEYKRIERDITLAKDAGACLHIAHVSCKESIELIADAKKKGIAITAETAPHYFALDEAAVIDYDTNMKMNPPLRTTQDRESIKQALKDGIIDVIASDHAPHTENEKDIEFERAEFGVTGLETELSASITELVNTNLLNWPELVKKMSFNPAQILGIDKGTLTPGRVADIIVVSGDRERIVKKEEFVSKSKNSPFLNRKLKGVVEYTICGGKIAYKYKKE